MPMPDEPEELDIVDWAWPYHVSDLMFEFPAGFLLIKVVQSLN